jgi:hypothetical protein
VLLVGYIYPATAQNLYRHKSGSTYGFYDVNNTLKIAYQYDDALNFNENLAAVKKAGKWGYINPSNITVIPFEYDDAWYFTQGLAAVKKSGKWGYIDANNGVIIPFSYSDAADFSDGLAWVEKNAQIGFISKTNEVVIPFQYNAANSFESGLAAVQKNGKWGYINKSNSVVIPMRYDDATYINDGFAPVKFGSYWGYFDTYGNQVTDFTFSTHSDESFVNITFGNGYASYTYKQLDNYKKGDSEYGMYLDHLKKAVQIIRKNQSYFSYAEWKVLAKYYQKIGDNENYKIAKKNSKAGGSSGKLSRPVLYLGTAPLKLAMTNTYHHFPLYAELSGPKLGLGFRYNTITNYADKWKFGGWRDSEDENYPYSGKEYSGLMYFKGKKNFKPGLEFRYGTYEFSPLSMTLTDKSTGLSVIENKSPKINTYDLTFILNFRKSWKFLYIESGYSFGLGYKKWDFGYDQGQFTNSLKRFEDKWMHLQVPFRVQLRAGIRL